MNHDDGGKKLKRRERERDSAWRRRKRGVEGETVVRRSAESWWPTGDGRGSGTNSATRQRPRRTRGGIPSPRGRSRESPGQGKATRRRMKRQQAHSASGAKPEQPKRNQCNASCSLPTRPRQFCATRINYRRTKYSPPSTFILCRSYYFCKGKAFPAESNSSLRPHPPRNHHSSPSSHLVGPRPRPRSKL